jgi:hypothetical protein
MYLGVPYAFNDILITYKKKKKKTCLTLHCIYYLILLFMASCCNVLETMSTRLKSLALAHGQHQLYVPGFNVCFRCLNCSLITS